MKKDKKKYIVMSDTFIVRQATVKASSEDEAIQKAYSIWDRRCIKAGGEPPVCWGVGLIKETS